MGKNAEKKLEQCQQERKGLQTNYASLQTTYHELLETSRQMAREIRDLETALEVCEGRPFPDPEPDPWQLIFHDDFDGPGLLPHWQTQFPWGRDRSSAGEWQYYVDDAFIVRDSILTIQAWPNSRPTQATHPYLSGLISTHKSFSAIQGRFAIRCKVPQGQGLWPACWLLPLSTEWPPELDVFEILGHMASEIHFNAHFNDLDGEHQSYGTEYVGPDCSLDFHEYMVEWNEDQLIWFFDGQPVFDVPNPLPDEPMYLIANLAVGGPTSWPGAPDETTPFPAHFDIDWIKVWRKS